MFNAISGVTYKVTGPFEVTDEVAEIFNFQNFLRKFVRFCSSIAKTSKCYEEIGKVKSRFFEQ